MAPAAYLVVRMSGSTPFSDYSRYFSLRQKVFLVNMSEERNRDVYESLSGVVVSSGPELLELQIAHGGHGLHQDKIGRATYKLTSEALGGGIQVLADLTAIVSDNVFQFRMHGILEMFQRRSDSRVKLKVPLFHLCRNLSLEYYRKEWQRVIDYLRNNSTLPGLQLKEMDIDISAGGIGLLCEAGIRPTPLSMFIVMIGEGAPVCALAEMAWEHQEPDGFRCGYRFIQIRKADQERIDKCVCELVRKSGGVYLDYKRNWVLMDQMVSDGKKDH